jgi:hypothetical protein
VAATTAAGAISTTRSSDHASRTFTPKSALPKNSTDPLEESLANALDPLIIPRFGTSGARDLAFPTPADGDRCYRLDLDRMERYDGTATSWLPTEYGAWTSFTPAWTSTGTAPVVGNGVFACKYMRLGKTVWVKFQFTPGNTTTFGTGIYTFALPVTSASTTPTAMGGARLTAAATWAGHALVSAASTFQLSFSTSSADTRLANMTNAIPETFANTHVLRADFCYELA